MSYTDQVIASLKKNLDSFAPNVQVDEIGTVVEVGDTVVEVC